MKDTVVLLELRSAATEHNVFYPDRDTPACWEIFLAPTKQQQP